MCTALNSAQPVANPLISGGEQHSQSGNPPSEKGDEAQLLPPLRNSETAQLQDPKIEDKETRPPPRYSEGHTYRGNAKCLALC